MTASDAEPLFLEPGTRFAPADIVRWAGKDAGTTLDEAIARADVLVSAPHAGSLIPGELREFLAPELTRRLQFDFTDQSTSPVVRRWAEIDERILVVENPHPRLVRDPNRARPADLRASLAEALARVRAAGPFERVDLTGVDAIRPVTFSFFPLLRVSADDDEAEIDRLTRAFEDAGTRGVDVYERTRDDLLERFAARAIEAGTRFTTLSFHDTMNTTTTREGAVNVPRAEADRLPAVVALSNRGDERGERRGEDASMGVTMHPDRVRALADAHRAACSVRAESDVALNKPYLGSQEIIRAGARFGELAPAASATGAQLDAVQAEFLREYLLGDANAEVLRRPGVGWIEPDPDHVDRLAHACRDAWALYRRQ